MNEKYIALSDIKLDIEYLQKEGCDDIPLAEVLERMELIVPAAPVRRISYGCWIVQEKDFGFSPATGTNVVAKEYECSRCGYKTGDQARKFTCCPVCTSEMEGFIEEVEM